MGMGYQGFVRIYRSGPASNPAVLLATGASVNQAYTPLPSNSVFGSGWYNAADAAHYADGSLHYEGSVDIDLEIGEDGGGNVGTVWDYLMKWAINERAYPRSMDISPDGSRMYQYRIQSGTYNGKGSTKPTEYDTYGAWCSEISFTTGTDSLVTSSLGVMALNRDETDPAGARNFSDYEYIEQIRGVVLNDYTASFEPTSPLNPDCENINPIPFWRTNAQILQIDCDAAYTPFADGTLPQTNLETIDWNVSDANNPFLLQTCDGNRQPAAVLMGPHNVSGSTTQYHPQGPFDPILGPDGNYTITSPYFCACDFKFRVQIRTNNTDPATYVYIELPAIYMESDTFDIPGQDSPTFRAYNMRGLGGREKGTDDYAMPPMIMSDSDGSFVAPDANP